MKKSTRILALVWVLVLLASLAYAGHALDSPVATTNPGDFWCSGNADFDGTVVFDGVPTFNTNAIFALDVSVGDDLTVTDWLIVEGTLNAQVGLLVGTTATVAGDVAVGDDLTVTDDATISGELLGARCLLGIGSSGENKTSDQFLRGAGNAVLGNTTGYMMTRAGSIVGATWMYSIDSHTSSPTIELEIRKNDAAVYELSDTITGAGVGDVRGTQARGVDTFVAGDIITAYIDVTGTIQYDMYGGYIEVQFDD